MIGWSLVVNASVVFFWNNVAVSGQWEYGCFIVNVSVGVCVSVSVGVSLSV